VVGSEDCLYLNVYVPDSDAPARGFPVLVWIHGGGLTFGAGSDYDPTPLVEKGGVIVVTINYRLGFLGFFAQSALDSERHPVGNYGLVDQQFALRWVRRNIGAFGGDRKRVTIFGESAGGLSVYSNIASPTAAGLFQRAISESGAYVSFAGHVPFADYLVGIVPLAVAESTGALGLGFVPAGNDVATSLGCGNQQADCLRALTATTIIGANPPGVFPFVHGKVFRQPPGVAFNAGNFNRVQVISGSNHDEWRYFVALQELTLGPLTDAEYPAAVAATVAFLFLPNPVLATELATNVYPLSNYIGQPPGLQRAPLALGALGTDIVFACPARNAALLLSKYTPTYTYEFNDETAPSFFQPLSFPLGDSHFIEVQYLFDLSAIGITPTFTSDQQQLSDTMISFGPNSRRPEIRIRRGNRIGLYTQARAVSLNLSSRLPRRLNQI
jgi:para-nitrobenzyl esterase